MYVHAHNNMIGVLYFTLGKSQYSAIHLVALCKWKYITLYSMNAVLNQQLVSCSHVTMHTIYIMYIGKWLHLQDWWCWTVFETICADNPASNLLGGFTNIIKNNARVATNIIKSSWHCMVAYSPWFLPLPVWGCFLLIRMCKNSWYVLLSLSFL